MTNANDSVTQENKKGYEDSVKFFVTIHRNRYLGSKKASLHFIFLPLNLARGFLSSKFNHG